MKRVVIWQIPFLENNQNRIIWWAIDAGAVGRAMMYGWQKQCAKDLGIHRITINRNVEILVKLGVMFRGEKKGDVGLRPEVFDGAVNRSGLKFRE